MRSLAEIRRAKARGEELTEKEYAALSAFWKSGASSNPTRKIKFRLGPQYKNGFTSLVPKTQVTEVKPEELRCSFCGNKTNRLEATTGKVPRFGRKDEILSIDPELQIEEKIFVKNNRVVACPNCANKIKPRIDKEGNYISHNTDYDFSLE